MSSVSAYGLWVLAGFNIFEVSIQRFAYRQRSRAHEIFFLVWIVPIWLQFLYNVQCVRGVCVCVYIIRYAVLKPGDLCSLVDVWGEVNAS